MRELVINTIGSLVLIAVAMGFLRQPLRRAIVLVARHQRRRRPQ